MSVTYTNFGDQLVHENRSGTERFYGPDTLGSTAVLLDSTGTVTDTFTYWPYGEIVVHTGASTTPFTFVGTFGYYLDLLGSLIYIRARHMRQTLCRWQTVDPKWPLQPAYKYVRNQPVRIVDPKGESSRIVSGGKAYPNFGGSITNFPNYGNYCGAQNDAHIQCQQQGIPDEPGIDCIDSACQAHDRCMQAAGVRGTQGLLTDGNECNCALAFRAHYCMIFGCNWGITCRGIANIILDAMAVLCGSGLVVNSL